MFLKDIDKKNIVEYINNTMSVEFIYLFGSFARGEGREDSDIDIAIYSNEIISDYDLFIMASNLSFEVHRDVQIINFKKASTVFKAQIIGNYELLYEKDEVFRSNFEIRALKEYCKLNEEREEILNRIESEGKVYGEGCII